MPPLRPTFEPLERPSEDVCFSTTLPPPCSASARPSRETLARLGIVRPRRAWPMAALATLALAVVTVACARTATATGSMEFKASAKARRAVSTLATHDGPAPARDVPARKTSGGKNPLFLQDPARAVLREAAAATKAGSYDRARTLYLRVTTIDPASSEALAGLGELDRIGGDLEGALASFERAAKANDRYFPALLAIADIEWERGGKATAAGRYAALAERFPGAILPPRLLERRSAH
jgi:tetratricopeptide (TPR) repeat protein